jgi:hypothetical protein
MVLFIPTELLLVRYFLSRYMEINQRCYLSLGLSDWEIWSTVLSPIHTLLY